MALKFCLSHDLDLDKFWLTKYLEKFGLPWNKKQTYFNQNLGLNCGHQFHPWPWPWPLIFGVKWLISYFSWTNGPIAWKHYKCTDLTLRPNISISSHREVSDCVHCEPDKTDSYRGHFRYWHIVNSSSFISVHNFISRTSIYRFVCLSKSMSKLKGICNINGLMQDCCISSALALEILQSCTKPSVWKSSFMNHASPTCRSLCSFVCFIVVVVFLIEFSLLCFMFLFGFFLCMYSMYMSWVALMGDLGWWPMVAYLSRHRLSCTGCWWKLLTMKWLMYECLCIFPPP